MFFKEFTDNRQERDGSVIRWGRLHVEFFGMGTTFANFHNDGKERC